jgi:hypothetical protein
MMGYFCQQRAANRTKLTIGSGGLVLLTSRDIGQNGGISSSNRPEYGVESTPVISTPQVPYLAALELHTPYCRSEVS